MKSIKARYLLMREKYPEPYSSYICFVRAIADQHFSYEMISKYFNILVEKDDYAPSDRKCLVDQLYYHSNPSEEKEFEGKNDPGATKKKKTVDSPQEDGTDVKDQKY